MREPLELRWRRYPPSGRQQWVLTQAHTRRPTTRSAPPHVWFLLLVVRAVLCLAMALFAISLCFACFSPVHRSITNDLLVQLGYPVSELARVRNGGRQEDKVRLVGHHDDGFLPDNTTVCNKRCARGITYGSATDQQTSIAHVVDFIENDPSNLFDNLRASVQHTSQNLVIGSFDGRGKGRRLVKPPSSSQGRRHSH